MLVSRLVPRISAQAIINTYNDLPFTGVEKWVAGVIYFGYLVGRAALRDCPREDIVIGNEEWETVFCTKI